jgi:hypothetical protein
MSHKSLEFKIDPIKILKSVENPSIKFFVNHDLLEDRDTKIENLWNLKPVKRILKKQDQDGFWKYPGRVREELRSSHDYNQLETFRMLGELVEKYGLNRDHVQIRNAADFLFKCQTDEGDFRGIYGKQYAPTYHPAIMELLIKAGYVKDSRIKKGFKWLNSVRQEDGGWAIPLRTQQLSYKDAMKLPEPIQPVRSKPFSHLVTGMVLRAFAAHPQYRKTYESLHAGDLMISRLFKNDKFSDRRDKKYWERVSYPFWFTDIVSTMDSLSLLGYTIKNKQLKHAFNFFIEKQNEYGLFDLKLLKVKDKDLKYWIALAICRSFKRFKENL